MNEPLRSIITQIHGSGTMLAIAVTGGGSSAIAHLLQVPGGSRTVLEAIVPYDGRSLAEYLGIEPEHACSAETAVAMARRARDRAAHLSHDPRCLGVGCTASLASDRPKKGDHRCHIAVASDRTATVNTIVLDKGARDRSSEEELVSCAVVWCLAEACGITSPALNTLLSPRDSFERSEFCASELVDRLFRGDLDRLTVFPDGQLVVGAPIPRGVLCGSFDPLHNGHIGLARIAEEIIGAPVSFELSVANVDKPQLEWSMIRRRAAQFEWRAPLELTVAPTFVEKSRLFPGTAFVVGADTAKRIVESKYYDSSDAAMEAALQTIADRGCRFLVGVRADSCGTVQSLSNCPVPRSFQQLFQCIPESRFRLDLSSTAIREHQGKKRF